MVQGTSYTKVVVPLWGIVWIVLMFPFKWHVQNCIWLRLAFIIDWKVVLRQPEEFCFIFTPIYFMQGTSPLVSMRGWNHKQTKLLLKPLSCCCLRDSTWNFPWQNCRLTLLYFSTSKLKLFTFPTAVWAKSNFSQSQWPCSMREAVQLRETLNASSIL